MTDDAHEAPPAVGRHRSVLLVAGLVVVGIAAVLLTAPALPVAARLGVGIVAGIAGLGLVAVAVLPIVRAAWLRPAFWGVLAAGSAVVAVCGDMGVRVPAVLIGLLALAQCALGVVVWRRSRA